MTTNDDMVSGHRGQDRASTRPEMRFRGETDDEGEGVTAAPIGFAILGTGIIAETHRQAIAMNANLRRAAGGGRALRPVTVRRHWRAVRSAVSQRGGASEAPRRGRGLPCDAKRSRAGDCERT